MASERDCGAGTGSSLFMALAWGFSRADHRGWKLDPEFSLAQADAGCGGLVERGAEFLLAALTPLVDR